MLSFECDELRKLHSLQAKERASTRWCEVQEPIVRGNRARLDINLSSPRTNSSVASGVLDRFPSLLKTAALIAWLPGSALGTSFSSAAWMVRVIRSLFVLRSHANSVSSASRMRRADSSSREPTAARTRRATAASRIGSETVEWMDDEADDMRRSVQLVCASDCVRMHLCARFKKPDGGRKNSNRSNRSSPFVCPSLSLELSSEHLPARRR